jgi:CBS domain-containing protein
MADAERFTEILFAIEELGALMSTKVMALGQYRGALRDLAARSPLSWEGSESPNTKRFEWLFALVKDVRNEAMHQGASARHATDRCVDLCLMLEDALATFRATVGHLMVTGIVEAKLHETVSAVRRTMLSHSFSFLPVQLEGGHWSLISDAEVARFLRQHHETCSRADRLAMPLSAALGGDASEVSACTTLRRIGCVEAAAYVAEEDDVNSVLARIDERPVLVTLNGQPRGRLVGILTSFDLL